MATQAQIAAVQQLYIGYLGRAADKAGLDFWTNAVATGVSTLESVATGFTLSNEYKAAFGGLTNDALVEKVYTSVLGRASDTAGKAFWVDALAKGTVTADKLVATFIGALGAPDQTIINNKTFVAQTYTDTAGTSYSAAAGTAVLVGVNNTVASVNTAIASISNGTLAGLTPGLGLIKAQETAVLAVTASEKALATSNPTLDADKNGTVDASEINVAKLAADQLRTDAFGAGGTVTSTATAKATLSDLTTATATAKTAATATAAVGGAKLVADYDNAIAAQTAVTGNAQAIAATTAAQKSAIAGFDPAATTAITYTSLQKAAGVATADAANLDTAQEVFDALAGVSATVTLTASQRAAVVTEINKAGVTGTALVAAADKAVAVAKAAATVKTANDLLVALKVGAAEVGKAYIDAVAAQKVQADIVTKVDAADANVAAVKVVVDNYKVLTDAVTTAGNAITNFDTAQTKITLHDVSASSLTGAADQADVFYFGSKVSTTDAAITNFGAGDSIVLSNALAYNAGALTTGNSSALEFFLVKSPGGVQIVVETAAYGNASTVTAADGTITTTTGSPDAAVITLTGVTADHLSVANGVVSYV